MENGYEFRSVCRAFVSKEENRGWLLSGTGFIRPEDTALYEGLVPSMKLATRVHENPTRILRAYIDNAHFAGNMLSLLEPNHAPAIYPCVLENNNITVKYENEKLIYTDEGNAFVTLEDNYAYQQND